MPENTWINRVLNMPEFSVWGLKYIAQGHCTNYWAVIEAEAYLEHSNI